LLSEEERNKLVKENPDYGRIVCNCEQVSLGELKDALNRSVPPHSIKGMKRRTRAGFGRCQGGYCLGTVSMLLAEKYGIELTEVNYDNDGSNLIVEKIKKVNND
jgi:glycerol-3-phosphate dehydrogenase